MRAGLILCLFALGTALPASVRAQEAGDLHIQTIDFDPGQVVQLRTAPGYELMVELSPDEQVRNVAIGDSADWQVSVSKEGNRLFLKPVQAGGRTNMTVVTSIRTYNFDLDALGGPVADMPYTIVFHYPPQRAPADGLQYVDVSAVTRRLSKYRITGDREIRPQAVSDDGTHTFISWPRSAPIPAIYAVDQSGRDVLVNGMMGTDDVYVLDGVPRDLIFRMDRSVARAERIFPRSRR